MAAMVCLLVTGKTKTEMQNETRKPAGDNRDSASLASGPTLASKKPFEGPRLTRLGDVRTLTMGPSPGIGDSGLPNTQPP